MGESGKFRYGIIGCGWVAPAHALGVQALASEDVELVAVADQDRARADDLVSRFGGATYADYRELLAREELDAVSVCVPDFLHEEVTAAAAAAGVHVLCEKPLATDVDGARRMVEVCRDNGVNLGIVFNHRYFPDNIRTRSAIREGALGRVLIGDCIHSSSLTGDPDNTSVWRGRRGLAAGGVLSTQAIHFLDLLLWFAGPVTSVKAWSDRLVRVEQDYEDTAALALRHASGALSTLVTTNAAPITDDFTGTRVEVQGTEGYVALEGDHIRTWQAREQDAPAPPALPELDGIGDDVVFGHGHIYEVIDFVRCARAGAPAPVPGVDGLHLMSVLDAAYRSSSEDTEVGIDVPDGAYAGADGDARFLLSGAAPR